MTLKEVLYHPDPGMYQTKCFTAGVALCSYCSFKVSNVPAETVTAWLRIEVCVISIPILAIECVRLISRGISSKTSIYF